MEKKVYENNIENAEKFLNNGMHKEIDKNELVDGLTKLLVKSESLSSVYTERISEEPTISQLLETSKNLSEEDTKYIKKLMRTKING